MRAKLVVVHTEGVVIYNIVGDAEALNEIGDAFKEAAKDDQPLAGVPFGVKVDDLTSNQTTFWQVGKLPEGIG